MNSNLSKYVDLIESFRAGQTDAQQFEKEFLQLFKNDEASVNYSEEIVDTLDSLFAAVDEYCADPALRLQLPKSLDERGLLAAANVAIERLRFLIR